MQVENLDAMTADELREYAKQLRAGRSSEVKRMLIAYTIMKVSAIEARLAGQISQAQLQEGACDVIYRNLPTKYRW